MVSLGGNQGLGRSGVLESANLETFLRCLRTCPQGVFLSKARGFAHQISGKAGGTSAATDRPRPQDRSPRSGLPSRSMASGRCPFIAWERLASLVCRGLRV